MTRVGSRLLAIAGLALAIVALPAPTRGTEAAMTAATSNSNVAGNLTLTSPTGLTATGTRFSVTLSWTGASPNNGNGYAISGVNNGASSTCPATASSYTTFVGSTASATTTYTDTGTIAAGAAGTWVCYLVQTGYSASGAPPWASAPQWTSQGSLATVAFNLAAIGRVQGGAEATGTTSVAPALAAGSTSGDLLVAVVGSSDATTAFSGPAGWTRAARATDATAGAVEIWYRANTTAGVTTATFSDAAATVMVAALGEYSGVVRATPLDQTGTVDLTTAGGSATVSTAAATSVSGELAVTAFELSKGTPSGGAGWTNLATDATNGFLADFQVQAAAAVESETASSTKNARWAGAIATFK